MAQPIHCAIEETRGLVRSEFSSTRAISLWLFVIMLVSSLSMEAATFSPSTGGICAFFAASLMFALHSSFCQPEEPKCWQSYCKMLSIVKKSGFFFCFLCEVLTVCRE